VKAREYRKQQLHNDRQNDHAGKKNGAHRTSTKRRLGKGESKCPFRLPLYCDENGYFMKAGVGCGFHQFHKKLNPRFEVRAKSRHITKEDKALLQDSHKVHVSPVTARNFLYIRNGGQLLSRDQIRSIVQSGIDKAEEDGNNDSVLALQKFFKAKRADCCFLYHAKPLTAAQPTRTASHDIPSPTLINEFHHTIVEDIPNNTYPSGTEEVQSKPITDLTQKEGMEMEEYAATHRGALGLHDNQELLLAVAWVLPAERRQFQCFPNVIHIDTTSDTNKEQRPLLTVTGRDSEGNQFTILRAFIPNECAWTFKWLFQNVFPTLLGEDALQWILLIITDGDPQETSQLDLANTKYFPNAFRARCIWHIVDRGMKVNFPNCPTRCKKSKRSIYEAWEKVQLSVRQWMWSWAESCCETEEELQLSKALFLTFVQSDDVREALGGAAAVEQLKDFHRRHVEPLEDFFVFHYRKSLLAFETNSNSAHEGTNKGMKSHSAPVRPQHRLDQAGQILTLQGELKVLDTQIRNSAKENSRKLWSSLPTANHLTDLGESLVINQWEQKDEYSVVGPYANASSTTLVTSRRTMQNNATTMILPNSTMALPDASTTLPNVNALLNATNLPITSSTALPNSTSIPNASTSNLPNTSTDPTTKNCYWLCMRCKHEPSTGVVPQFRRVRRISRDATTGFLTCDCNYFERVGVPCRHLMSLLSKLHNKQQHGIIYQGVTHHDVRVLWWKKYGFHGMGIGRQHQGMKQSLSQLRDYDTKGPILIESLIPPLIVEDPSDPIVQTLLQALAARCINYSEEHCCNALKENAGNERAPPFLSQDISVFSESDSYLGDEDDNGFDFTGNMFPSPKRAIIPEQCNDSFKELIPILKEICGVLDASDPKHTLACKVFLNEKLVMLKEEFNTSKAKRHLASRVSSHLPTNKRFKSHGTKHYK
jgi:hypothetical protein